VIKADIGDGKSKKRHLGCFVNEVDAALAYDQAAREYHGDKAKPNFPDLPPQPQVASSQSPTPQSLLQMIFPPVPPPPGDDTPSLDEEGLWVRPTPQQAHAASCYVGKSIISGFVPELRVPP
jgi:hypothetical protein